MNKYDSETKQCPICGSSDIAQHHKDFRENTIYKCSQCKVQFLNPVYSDEYLDDYYTAYYSGEGDDNDVIERQENTNEVKLKFIQKCFSAPGKLLDFGCGNGNFLSYAKDRGWEVTGYDVDCTAMKTVGERLAISVKCGSLSKVDFVDEEYDLIHAHHVIEHLKNPMADMKILNKSLKKGGYFYISVPDIGSTSARIKYFFEKIGLRRKNIGKYYDSDHHVFFYTAKSMQNLVERCGFKVELVENAMKSHVSKNPIIRFLTHTLPGYFYTSSGFIMMARKL